MRLQSVSSAERIVLLNRSVITVTSIHQRMLLTSTVTSTGGMAALPSNDIDQSRRKKDNQDFFAKLLLKIIASFPGPLRFGYTKEKVVGLGTRL